MKNIFKKAEKKENRKVKVTVLNLFTKEVETAEVYENGLTALICHGFDILKIENT